MPEQPQIDWPALILKADESSDPERALATLANMATRRDPAPVVPVGSEDADDRHASIVCDECGDSTRYRCQLRGCTAQGTGHERVTPERPEANAPNAEWLDYHFPARPEEPGPRRDDERVIPATDLRADCVCAPGYCHGLPPGSSCRREAARAERDKRAGAAAPVSSASRNDFVEDLAAWITAARPFAADTAYSEGYDRALSDLSAWLDEYTAEAPSGGER